MAKITVFQNGVGREAPQVTPFRAPDFGPGIGGSVQRAGQFLGETAQKLDEIQDVNARIEANTHSVAFSLLGQSISQKVHTTLGADAEAAADKGIADLEKGSDQLLARASPRARAVLQPQFQERLATMRGELLTYAFEQKKQAFDTSSQAANDHDLEDALRTSDDAAAKPYLDSIAQRNHQRAAFFGLPSAWVTQENLKAVSSYHRGRAIALGANSAYDAVHYAIDHRNSMSEDDYNAVVNSYRGEALHEQAVSMYYGMQPGSEPTIPAPRATRGDSMPTKTADPSTVFKALIIPNEGTTLVQHDSNGAPVKYGINQKENPDVDVSKLTASGAEKLFIDRYWKASGADKLPPALAVIHADTFFLNESEASRILKESKGDVQTYMELRDNFLARLHASNPKRYPDYTSRNKRVAQYAASIGGDGTPLSFSGKVGPDTPMQPIIDEVMQRKDLPLGLKTAIIDVAREDRNAQREDKVIRQDDARDKLITATTQLGANFTSLKQLPGETLANASPETVASLTDLARTNRYKKDDEGLRPYVTFIEVTDPDKFQTPDFLQELMRRGASPSLLSDVQTQQATIAKKQMSAKPDVISDRSLWDVAKPAFEAAGILSSKTGNEQKNAKQEVQAVVFLQKLATEWAVANPGQRATPELMRQWVGAAMLHTRSGSYLYQASDADVYNSLPDAVRSTIIRDLRRRGDAAQGNDLVRHVASVYRQLRALYGTGPINLAPGARIEGSELRGVPQGSMINDSGSDQ